MQSQIADLYLSRLSDLAHSYTQPFPAASLVYGCIRIDRNPRAPLALDLPTSATYARRVRSCLLSLKLALRSDARKRVVNLNTPIPTHSLLETLVFFHSLALVTVILRHNLFH